MKVKWKGESDPFKLIHDKVYDVVGTAWKGTMVAIVDEVSIAEGNDLAYYYFLEDFEVVEGSVDEFEEDSKTESLE